MTKSEDPVPGFSEDLSALVDGEFTSTSVDRVCARWREDADTRAAWHTCQLIGDVLRSGDLASSAQHDSDFLAALRQRLSQEPVVLAPGAVAVDFPRPEPVAVGARPRPAWRTSIAVAAGFVAVAGVLGVIQLMGSPGGASMSPPAGAVMARAEQGVRASEASVTALVAAVPVGAVSVATRQLVAADGQSVVLNGQLIRDARLDEYLAAHKKFGGSSAPGVPSGFLRNAAVEGR